jgi:alkylated DNA repair dioxygenase AlkB
VRTELEGGWLDYKPDFLNQDEQLSLFNDLLEHSPWKQGQIRIFGKTMNTPRLEAFFAEEGLEYAYSGQQLKVHPFTPQLLSLKSRIEEISGERFNSVLINLYRDGSDSNGWHADNEKELGLNPLIASVSLGVERRFDLRHNNTGQSLQLILRPGSLLIMGGELQHNWKHQIAKSKKITQPRINLTFRKIIKV